MIFNLSSGMSVSSCFNFTFVTGTTKPAAPKTNTIWCNTSTACPAIYFNTAQTNWTPPASGYIQIHYEASAGGDNEYGASRLWFFDTKVLGQTRKMCGSLTECYQYVDSKWKKIEAWLYNAAGEWTQFSAPATQLFKTGDLCTATTGGWTGLVVSGSDQACSTGTSSNLTMTVKARATGFNNVVLYTTKEITKGTYTKLVITAKRTSLGKFIFGFIPASKVGSADEGNFDAWAEIVGESTAMSDFKTVSLDLSSLASTYKGHVQIRLRSHTSSSVDSVATITDVHLE